MKRKLYRHHISSCFIYFWYDDNIFKTKDGLLRIFLLSLAVMPHLQARRYPEYDAMMNWIHKDPSFNTNDDVRRIAKCRNHLNKWFRAMNRALEPAGLEVVIVKDEEDNNRKYFSIVNLVSSKRDRVLLNRPVIIFYS